ncbi:MAG: hypothetical protein A2Y12_16190 [Planctomycetes bacterium GWF2_42_9]|nr:MAG: hypothetical protein A2Y12_16190 [Planctomycetes bacterium GWF2_42_9]
MAVACVSNSVLAVPVTAGLVLQLDMSSVTTDGSGNVTSWNDLSGNGNNAVQATGSLQPVFVSSMTPTGASAIKFDGTDDYLDIVPNSTFDGGSFTMFAVYAVDAFDGGSGTRRLINLGYADIDPGTPVKQITSTYSLIVGSGTTGVRSTSRNVGGTGIFAASGIPAGYATDTFYVAAATMDSVSTNATAYLIDSAGSVTSAFLAGATAVGSGNNVARIGAGTSGNTVTTPSVYLNGWVSEILIYNTVLTSDEIADVSEYLANKYIPEPATISLLMLGLGLFIRRGK